MEIEAPLEQNETMGRDRGVDSHSASRETKDVLVWSFSSPISFFGAQMVDIESSASERAKLRLFDCSERLITESDVIYPNNEQGQKQNNFIGFYSSKAEVCHISLSIGDYERPDWKSRSNFRGLAVDEFIYGK